MKKTDIENLLAENYGALERYVKFRISNTDTAKDVVQDICVAVLANGEKLNNPSSFRPWLYRIARNKLNDVYRHPAHEIQSDRLDMIGCSTKPNNLHDTVNETLLSLNPSDRELLKLCYMSRITQAEAAQRLGLPLGTLKTRLTAAKNRFREKYPYTKRNEDNHMNEVLFPRIIPDYSISQRSEPPFEVLHEAIIGWGIVPRLGEKCSWASYDFPEKRLTEIMKLEVTGRVVVHGIEGVEIKTLESGWDSEENLVFASTETERWFVAQLTSTHCRLLSEMHYEDGVKKLYTFLDGSPFLDNWGYGEDNCGFETHLRANGHIKGTKDVLTSDSSDIIDVCGRFDVTLCGKVHDTIRLVDIETYDTSVMTETYINKEGKIVLWRRFNRNDWRFSRIGMLWSEKFPENETVTINGETYVHWYDCLYDYMLD